jgi:mitochondrial inner membrane protease ATP23
MAGPMSDPMVLFVAQALNRKGCAVSSSLVECAQCTPGTSGGFEAPASPGVRPRVLLCCGRIKSKEHASQVVTHELIHAYDYCRSKMSPDNFVHHACTEIRAANLSGDCDLTAELARGKIGFRKHRQVKAAVVFS